MKQLHKQTQDMNLGYANCWEDADVLLEALEVNSGDKVFSIGSAGDNSFSMLVFDPEHVLAVDINVVQLHLIELKKGAFATLDYESFLQFLGFRDFENRWNLFLRIKKNLSPQSVKFWEGRRKKIENGIINEGKLEKYFMLFRHKFLPLIHSKERIRSLFEEKSDSQQQEFFDSKWNTWRWRMLFTVFFSKFVMAKVGRNPEFLKEVKIPVSTFILEKAKRHLGSVNCQDNYFLQFILTGKFMTGMPHYARKENFDKIKTRLDRLTIYHGSAESAFEEYRGFNKFNLSNIFEYMSLDSFKSISVKMVTNSAPNSRYAYWNLMVPRGISDVASGYTVNVGNRAEIGNIDKGFFYENFNIEVSV